MTLTEKLLGYLNRVFDKGPDSVLALRLNYDGAMTWRVSAGVLTTTVIGGTGGSLTVALSGFSMSGLAAYLAAQPGYSVPFAVAGEMSSRSALAIIEAGGNPAQSNGDHLMAFQSVLWAYLGAQASELSTAQIAISEALLQIAAITASDTWVDEHGSYYGVARTNGEADVSYVARIVSEITRARGNGVAIAEAVKLGATASYVTITDVPTVTVSGGGVGSYGLFDVDVEIPVESVLTQPQIEANTLAVLNAMRDAGTHVRNLRYIRTVSMRMFVGGYSTAGHRITLGLHRLESLDGYTPLDAGPPAPISYRYWRLAIDQWYFSGVAGTAGDTRVCSWRLFEAGGAEWPAAYLTANNMPPYTADASSGAIGAFPAWQAFAGALLDDRRWISVADTAPWLQIDLGSAQPIASCSIAPDGAVPIGYFPSQFRVLASNTGAFTGEEVTRFSASGLSSGWSANALRTFTFP